MDEDEGAIAAVFTVVAFLITVMIECLLMALELMFQAAMLTLSIAWSLFCILLETPRD